MPSLSLPNFEHHRFSPRAAFVVSKNDAGNTLVTHHNCTGEDKPKIGAGCPISTDTLHDLVSELISPDMERFKVVPSGVIATSSTGGVWCVKGSIRPMWFRQLGEEPFAVNVPWPNLVFVYTHKTPLRVFAYKNKGKPDMNSGLFHAPLMNIYSDGSMCFGSVKLNTSIDSYKAREEAVFDSNFSHVNHSETMRGISGNEDFIEVYKDLAESNAKTFPTKRLIPIRGTLGSILEEIE